MDIELSIKNYRCFQKPAVINLSKGFTALVGANNSGKSSLLKFFYEFRNMFVMLGNTSVLLDVIRGQLQPLNLLEVTDPTDIFCNQNDRDIELTFTFKPGRALNTADPVKLVITVLRNQNGWQCRLYYWEESTNRERAIDGQQDLTFETDTLLRYLGSIRISFEEILPIFGAFGRTLYIGPFRNVLNIGANPNYYDLQVGEAFVTMWRSLQTGSSTANRNATYALSKKIGSIFDFDEFHIQAAESNKTLQVFINGKSFYLNDVGSGMTQFILTLANAAIKKPAYILIDEPELNLHPSLQIDFLNTLASFATHGVYFATHNIGLARIARNILSFTRKAEGQTEIGPFTTTPRLAEFIGELSYGGYQAIGFEKILLVEGRTGLAIANELLRLYKKNHKIVLVNIKGSEIINGSNEAAAELEELTRITDQIYALIDSERDSETAPLDSKRQGFQQTCNRLGITLHILKRRAIENYFPDRAIKEVVGQNFRQLDEYERLEDVTPHWTKKLDNWRIASAIKIEEIEGTDLDHFLKSL